jgi:hypothetical protein
MRAACGSLRIASRGCARISPARHVSVSAAAAVMVQKLDGPTAVTDFIEDVNVQYEKVICASLPAPDAYPRCMQVTLAHINAYHARAAVCSHKDLCAHLQTTAWCVTTMHPCLNRGPGARCRCTRRMRTTSGPPRWRCRCQGGWGAAAAAVAAALWVVAGTAPTRSSPCQRICQHQQQRQPLCSMHLVGGHIMGLSNDQTRHPAMTTYPWQQALAAVQWCALAWIQRQGITTAPSQTAAWWQACSCWPISPSAFPWPPGHGWYCL